MRRISRSAIASIAFLTTALCILGGAGIAAAQEGYYRRYYDEAPRYERRYDERRASPDDDAYFQQRLRYYQRDAVARRQAARRAAEDDDVQPRRRPRSGFGVPFLQRLFGGSAPDDDRGRGWGGGPDPGAVEVRPKPNRVRRKPPTVAPAAPPPTDVATPQQTAAPPSTFVAVIGDSIADGLAGGLAEAFADAPELAVKRYAKANAGLVRADYFDFVDVARKAVASDPITYAVIDVGVNDRQPFLDMRDAAPLTDRWRQRYVARVDALLAPFKERKIPVYWVGLAPSESMKASSDHTALNALIRERVEAAGGTYVDVWEGFVDEDGDYVDVGPQLDGQTVKLRLDDGVHFSRAGARKLAHYVEQEIRKVFQPTSQPATDALLSGLTPGTEPGAPPGDLDAPPSTVRPKRVAGPLVVLTGPLKAEGGVLLGAPRASAAPLSVDAAQRVLVRGEALDPDPGRLDDHRWPGVVAPLDPPPPAAAGKP